MAIEGSPPPAFGATLRSANENCVAPFVSIWCAVSGRGAGAAPEVVAASTTMGTARAATATMTRLLARTVRSSLRSAADFPASPASVRARDGREAGGPGWLVPVGGAHQSLVKGPSCDRRRPPDSMRAACYLA